MKLFLSFNLLLLARYNLVLAKGGRGGRGGGRSSSTHSSATHYSSNTNRGASGGRNRRSNSGGTRGGTHFYTNWGSSCSTGNSDDDGCGITTTQAGLYALLAPFMFVVVQLGQCLFGPFNTINWNRRIKKAKEAILKDAAAVTKEGGYSITESLPETISFLAAYTDSSDHSGTMEFASRGTLEFSSCSIKGVRSITGNGNDADGCFAITQGQLAPFGKCYWVAETPARKAIVTGIFVPDSNGILVFEGQWDANDGAHGTFTSFDLSPSVYLLHHSMIPSHAKSLNDDKTQTLLAKGGSGAAIFQMNKPVGSFVPLKSKHQECV